MQLWIPTALLILQCLLAPLVLASDWQTTGVASAGSLTNAGTVTFKGTRLRAYQVGESKVAEPRVAFTSTCGNLRFNQVFRMYQLSIPISVDANVLGSKTSKNRLAVTDIQVKADPSMARSGVRVSASVRSSGRGFLTLLCHSYLRCRALRDAVAANPRDLWNAVEFLPVGVVHGTTVKFLAARSARLPRIRPCGRGQWITFQRRINGDLSFARPWDEYVKGFGNPKSNYWMGLDRLFARTATAKKNGYTATYRCALRIDTVDFNGKKYWSEYGSFEVLSPQDRYQLRISKAKRGSMINMMAQNGMSFSTYDRDHDGHRSASCSRLFGYGGWWYNGCHAVNLNGAYTTDRSVRNNPNFDTVYHSGRHIPMKTTLMRFRCN